MKRRKISVRFADDEDKTVKMTLPADVTIDDLALVIALVEHQIKRRFDGMPRPIYELEQK